MLSSASVPEQFYVSLCFKYTYSFVRGCVCVHFLCLVNTLQERPEAETHGVTHEDESPPCTPPSERIWMESRQEAVSDGQAVVFWVVAPCQLC